MPIVAGPLLDRDESRNSDGTVLLAPAGHDSADAAKAFATVAT